MLTRCIATDAVTFAGQFWGREPLLSRADALPRDFSDLLSAEHVDELLAERGVRAPFIRIAKGGEVLARDCYLGPAGFGAEMPDQVDSAKLLGQFASGATIVLQGLHRLWPPLIDFVRAFVDDVGHPVQANAYVTPPGSRGFDPHYDVHDVFVLQTSGHKHWLVHEPVHPHPLPAQPWTAHRDAVTDRAKGEPVIDAVLRPGDALYLPRGWVHSARSGDATSIHLTIGVATLAEADVVRAIVDQLDDVSDFRQSLAMGIDPTDRDEMAAIATKIMARLVETMQDRGADLAQGAALRLARLHADRTRPVAVRPLATLNAMANAATVTVAWRHGLVGNVERKGERVLVRLPDRTISFPQQCGDALATLHRGMHVDATSLPGLDAADGEVVIRRLLREAVVTPVEQDGGDR